MANDFYQDSGNPATGSSGSSALIRAEFAAIEAGFDKLPGLTDNGGKVVKINTGATAMEASKVTVTEPATGSTLTIADGKTLTASNTLTLAGTDGTTMTFPSTSGAVVTEAATQTLTNKTLTSPTLTTPALGTPASGTLTNCTGLPPTGLSSTTGSGAAVLATSPTLVTPILGIPASGDISNCTGSPTLTGTNISGTAAGLSIGGNAATATSATTVTGASQPNITSVGALASLYTNYLRRNLVSVGQTYSVDTTDSTILCGYSLGTTTLTLPAATGNGGREIIIRTTASQAVVSNAANVIPITGGSAGSAILSATAGKWAILQSDNANWQIIAAN